MLKIVNVMIFQRRWDILRQDLRGHKIMILREIAFLLRLFIEKLFRQSHILGCNQGFGNILSRSKVLCDQKGRQNCGKMMALENKPMPFLLCREPCSRINKLDSSKEKNFFSSLHNYNTFFQIVYLQQTISARDFNLLCILT